MKVKSSKEELLALSAAAILTLLAYLIGITLFFTITQLCQRTNELEKLQNEKSKLEAKLLKRNLNKI